MLRVDRRRLALRALAADGLVPVDISARLHVHRGTGAAHDDDMLDRGQIHDGLVDIRFQWDSRATPPAAVRGDQDLGARIGHSIAHRLGGETAEDHAVGRAQPRAGQHGDRGFGNERQVDANPVAASDPHRLERVREAAGLGEQLGIGEDALFALAARAERLPLPDEGHPLAVASRDVTIEAVGGDVELPALEPARVRRLPVEDALERLVPGESFGLLPPERLRRLDGLPVQRLVFRDALEACFPREVGGRRKGPALGFDAVEDGASAGRPWQDLRAEATQREGGGQCFPGAAGPRSPDADTASRGQDWDEKLE